MTQSLLERITTDPAIFAGKPIIRGMRVSVETILSLLAQGSSWAEILDDYPDLVREDIQACLINEAVRLSLLEDAEDLLAIEAAREEAAISFEGFAHDLDARGNL